MTTQQSNESRIWTIISRIVVFSVFWMIFVGGLVTSKDAGMAVPDWPMSFGSWNPPGWWEQELVALEHGHRLFGALTGIFVIALLVTMALTPRARPYLWLGWVALVGVIIQGFLGGFRVRLETAGIEQGSEALVHWATTLRVLHGFLAQAYLCLVIAIAMLASPPALSQNESTQLRRFRWPLVCLTAALFFQLVTGATMRHLGWGLAIPDFPLSNGQWIPEMTSSAVVLAFAHRAWAFVIAGGILWLGSKIFLDERQGKGSRFFAGLMVGLVAIQILLGASVIWMREAPIPTTFHVLNGAFLLGTTFTFLMRTFLAKPQTDPADETREAISSPLENAQV